VEIKNLVDFLSMSLLQCNNILTTKWWEKLDLLSEYTITGISLISNAKLRAPEWCTLAHFFIDFENNKQSHGGARGITNSPKGLVLVRRTACPQKIQYSVSFTSKSCQSRKAQKIR